MKLTRFFLIALCVLLLPCVSAFATQTELSIDMTTAVELSPEREATVQSIQKISDYENLNIYSMEIFYDYDLSRLTPVGVYDTQSLMELCLSEALPGVSISYTAPDFGCSAFTLKNEDGTVYMGRNYDFGLDSSAMIVRCRPKDGYASVAHCALDNLQANDALSSDATKLSCLAAPFICLDGINEKGVGIAVLTLDSEPTCQKTGKPVLSTGILIRLVLDKAATTQEAIDLISQYDVCAIAGRDYHFYITDATGDGRVVEFEPNDPARPLIDTPTEAVTNFFIRYSDLVEPNQKNGIYGHGKERYLSILDVFSAHGGQGDASVAMEALEAASQLPNPESVTSNTQWSIVYDLTNLSWDIVLHRAWEDVYSFTLSGN